MVIARLDLDCPMMRIALLPICSMAPNVCSTLALVLAMR